MATRLDEQPEPTHPLLAAPEHRARLHLHQLLLAHTAAGGGAFKTEDDLVVDRLPDATHRVRFRPVSARQTPWFVEELSDAYGVQRAVDVHHPLLLVGLFVLDLLVIHPFEDGSGRVARVLTTALLADSGFGVARYTSLERLVAESADDHYAALLASTHGWHDGEHDPWPWLGCLVTQVGIAYRQFQQRAAAGSAGGTEQDRVTRYVLEQAPPVFRIADIRAALPGVSDATLRLVLDEVRRSNRVQVDGSGRSATWTRLPSSWERSRRFLLDLGARRHAAR